MYKVSKLCLNVCVCLLTVLTLHHSIVALLSEGNVAQMQDACYDLQHCVLLIQGQTHNRHGLLTDMQAHTHTHTRTQLKEVRNGL